MKKKQNDSEKTPGGDIAKALDSCAGILSLNEFARVTGVRLELLRRFVNKNAHKARADTWDKIYPTLKPYITGPEPEKTPLFRIGRSYRRHAELVEMVSDQKVLLDEFDVLPENIQKQVVADFSAMAEVPVAPTAYESLSALENQLMGAFMALPADKQREGLLKLTETAVAEVRRRRSELF